MRWSDVTLIHKALGGVYVKGGRLVSLLATPESPYQNQISRDSIRYAINPKKTELVQAFESALSRHHTVRVFYRERPGIWTDLGRFKVARRADPGLGESNLHYYILASVADMRP